MNRQLTPEEIKQLESQGCSAEDWTKVLIEEKFDINRIHHTHFEGKVEMRGDVSISHVGLIKNIFIEGKVADFPVSEIGQHFEVHPFFPAKTNTEFVERLAKVEASAKQAHRRIDRVEGRVYPGEEGEHHE